MPSTAPTICERSAGSDSPGWWHITQAPGGEAELSGKTAELAEFTDEASATSMALTYCDMTTGPAGEVITYEERLAGVERRYGAEHVVARSVRQARTE